MIKEIKNVSIMKNCGTPYVGDIEINFQGGVINDTIYVSEMGLFRPYGVDTRVGLTYAEVEWLENKARELLYDRKHSCYFINLKSGKIQKC